MLLSASKKMLHVMLHNASNSTLASSRATIGNFISNVIDDDVGSNSYEASIQTSSYLHIAIVGRFLFYCYCCRVTLFDLAMFQFLAAMFEYTGYQLHNLS
jgi:hypothetical protein